MRRVLFILSVVLLVSSGCEYNKILNKGTNEQKLEAARKYYKKKDYNRASILLENLIGNFRGEQAEEVYYLFAYSKFAMQEFYMAQHLFTNFTTSYPNSKYATQAAFMSARCQYHQALASELDQTNTTQAIEAIQIFINRYPTNDSVESGNKLIDELRSRLHEKAFNSAMLYFNMENYLAAYTAFKNAIINYPDLPEIEKAHYYKVESAYRYAKQSVKSVQEERYETTIVAAKDFLEATQENKYTPKVKDLMEKSKLAIEELKKISEQQ
ncbi:MAG: outer membrane protein assembly factor BamD [Flavobacteriales bacterium]|nr:outer membrane protein assembly factor BamD [Flavobacteriales bacterium]